MAIAEAVLADYTGNPRVAAFWAPRFARFAAWFAETEAGAARGHDEDGAEVDGKMVLAGPAGPFTLKARADRIDVGNGGSRHHRLQERRKACRIWRARRRAARRRSFPSRRPSPPPAALPTCRPVA